MTVGDAKKENKEEVKGDNECTDENTCLIFKPQ